MILDRTFVIIIYVLSFGKITGSFHCPVQQGKSDFSKNVSGQH